VRAQRLIGVFFLFISFSVPGYSQAHQTPLPRNDPTAAASEPDENRERAQREMAKKANLERQAALKVDTDKLVKLAAELKEYVDKSNENMLSLDVLKKAEEIEKLAKSVKEKMKGPH
jgi:spore coat polysaccharide biosynthesis protein SpsF (cytidylyltransferase family)